MSDLEVGRRRIQLVLDSIGLYGCHVEHGVLLSRVHLPPVGLGSRAAPAYVCRREQLPGFHLYIDDASHVK